MTSLIRKVWVSVVSRSGSSSGSAHMSNPNPLSDHDRFLQMMYIQTSSTGEFDRIPIDIFMQILKILGPRESARVRAVCKAWKFLVSDNRLWIYFLQNQPEPWDSVFFAETHLRSGYPLQVFPSQMHDLSFMHIYGQREEAPGALIIDGGSGYCKYGWSKYSSPSGRSATFLEFGNIESPMPSRLRHFFSTICNRMQVKTSTQPIVVSIPLCHYDNTESAKSSRRQLKDAMYSTLFDMNVPAVCAVNQATLALFAARRTSGVVVNVGFHQTSVVPILHGKVMHKVGVEVVGMGALKLTGFLRDRMQQNNIHFDSLYTVRTLKEARLSKRYEIIDALPYLLEADETVVVFPARLEKELYGLLPPSISSGIRVLPPPYGTDSAWYGGKLVSNVISAVVDKSFVYVGIISVRPAKK
ncbi:UNVERIFIED_CONTAM: Actin-related protein 8 [Sesamum latifolium]|uniref:Actin-related protein 8 n=1 Tax=Sesamum latifolium TaxID=2727402 RepID=A0AAW2WMR1_9LAMI